MLETLLLQAQCNARRDGDADKNAPIDLAFRTLIRTFTPEIYMNRAKRILQWTAGIGVGLYLALVLLLSMPAIQRWAASGVARLLGKTLETRVEVGRVSVGWNGRILVDDLVVWDRQQAEMLRVARVGARLSMRDLVQKRIRIGNAQLFGMHANLYQQCPECPPNFKFLIDAFASKDSTRHTPLDLSITQLLVRRGEVRYSNSTQRLHLADLNLTAQLGILTDDSINVRVKRLDVCEERGLCVKSLKFALEGNRQEAQLRHFELLLPNSRIEIPTLTAHNLLPFRFDQLRYEGTLVGHLSPTDLAFLLPKAGQITSEANLNLGFTGVGDNVNADLHLWDDKGLLNLKATGYAGQLRQAPEGLTATIDIREAYAENALWRPYVSNDILNRIESLRLNGYVAWAARKARGEVNLLTPLGGLTAKGSGDTDGRVDITAKSDGLELGTLLDRKDLGLVAFDMKAKGTLGKQPDLALSGTLPEADYRGYRYRNITLDGQLHHHEYEGRLAIEDANASLSIQGAASLREHHYQVKAEIEHIAPNTLNLTKRYKETQFSGEVLADLRGNRLQDLAGNMQLNRFSMADSTGIYRPGDIHVTSKPSDGNLNLMLISPFLEAQVQGDFQPEVLVGQVRRMLSQYLPTIKSRPESTIVGGQGSFTLRAYNAEPLRRLLGIPLTLEGMTTATGELDSRQNALWVTLKSPGIQYGKERLQNIEVGIESNYESVFATAEMQRMMKGRWVTFGLDTRGDDGRLTTRLYFDNKMSPSYKGDINISSHLWQDAEGRQGFEGRILSSSFTIGDTLWSVHPGHLSYYDNALQIDSFAVSQGERFIRLNGRASSQEADTLHAHLQRVNLEYIFSLINFHAVELTGEATGHAYAHSLFASPKADAYIRIPQFTLNYGTMGDLDIHLNWGERPYSIFLDGIIDDTSQPPLAAGAEGSRTLVKGYITPKKDISYHGIDLNVQAQRVNLEFINKWTSAVFDDLQGRATGWVHIFGPFKQINIEGDAMVNEASVGIPFIGVRYHLLNDSVRLRPDNIYFHNARLYDPQGAPNVTGHSALVNGHLHHDSFKNLTYDISIDGNNILGYNFTDFADMNFYGTVYATGNVALQGSPGNVRIDIKAHPERGTTFTYNATSPDKLTETPFISYVQRVKSEERRVKNLGNNIEAESQSGGDSDSSLSTPQSSISSPPLADAPSSDLHINFDLDIDQQSTMNLLMDVRSGDKITLNGSGHMLAHYYNKGSFDLFGTYRVSRGTYNLSLQEVIRKNFEFSNDGTITFNGEPYDADLNLQAVHTVSGVSLNDINPKANFSNNSARVNCLMNIGGKARAPRITFDFDVLNANEDEKQMVRSLISTEEERNMQVIYLLGIGRFYAYDYANTDQNQSTTAMYSVLSSTLSGTINQVLSNMLGKTNWNFGANLRTGEDGWNDMDVEGMLQGNLLNNRLLLNGNFGYRDNPMATTNFIGDFDVKYLLTRSGTVALKAYSETNDRYFTKSSLTTQGIGVLLKKDFTSWRDLIIKRKRTSKGEKKDK